MRMWGVKVKFGAYLVVACVIIGSCAASLEPALAEIRLFGCNAKEAAMSIEHGSIGRAVHVLCNPGDTITVSGASVTVSFFALAGTHPDAGRFLSVAQTAVATGRRMVIFYEPTDLSGETAIGCLNRDCRLITGAAVTGDIQQ